MVFGAPERERLQLNEETIWAGGPNNNVKADALPVVQQLRTKLLVGQVAEAQALAKDKMQPVGNSGMPYQMAANVYLAFPGHEQATNYQRDLDISRAVASVSYQVGGVRYRREMLSSLADQVIIVRLTASQPGKISCQLSAESLMQHTLRAENNQLVLDGRGSEHEGQPGQIRFQLRGQAVADGGTVQTTDAGIRIDKANSATLYFSIGTSFVNYHDVSGDAAARATAYLSQAVGRKYETACAAHTAAYRRYFNRVSLNH
jgi:alpha-L-fucosidase 2